jgi:hypothetical protein
MRRVIASAPMAPEPHVDLRSLALLLGTWRGEGEGEYPTIDPFRYGEEMVFEDVGDTFLLYRQASWLLDDERTPLHFERGFLRIGAEPGSLELALAHPLGLTEVSEGRIDGSDLFFTSDTIGRTRTGSAVSGLERRYHVDGDRLTYELDMAMDEIPMTRHLAAELRRDA